MTTKLLLALSTGALFAMVACGGDDGGQGQTSSTRCDPGETKACACSATQSGTKVCGDDKKWETCQCGSVQPDVIDDPDVSACTPECDGKVCGFDGCSGTCGSCATGQYCDAGACVTGTCTPDCTDRECGDDGCGALCGSCGAARSCVEGRSVGGCEPSCADKQCGPDGCGGVCGACPQGETCQPDYTCKPGTCTPDCEGRTCGPDGCDGVCGTCEAGCTCTSEGQCAGDCGCEPACSGRECGSDGCGGSCGSCYDGQTCNDAGQCQGGGCFGVTCGLDGEGGVCGGCEAGTHCVFGQQSCSSSTLCPELLACAQGCLDDAYDAVSCVFALCDPSGTNPTYTALLLCVQQACSSSFTSECAYDALDGICASEHSECQGGCSPSCSGKQCGSDGCGGSCGTCSYGYACNAYGQCTSSCTPSCSGKQCGSDGCGGSCGSCASGYSCSAAGKCVAGCTPDCTYRECGTDGCGGSCGTCASGTTCDDYGACQPTTGCGAITYEGCCVGTVTKWCDTASNTVAQVDCTTNPSDGSGTKCGWDATNKFYYCVPTASSDPSGTNPYACP